MTTIFDQIRSFGIIPVVIIENENAAESLAEALLEGGLPCAEVTFRTDAAKNAISRMKKLYPSMLIGAGTVLSIDQVKMATDAGAQFIVSPGINPAVVEYCLKHEILIIPGVVTPTEIEIALERKLKVVKFFPAEACGGIKYLKAISAPYKNIGFIPTGGIDETNVLSYINFDRVLACGGSWMVRPDLIAKGAFHEIRNLTRSAVTLIRERPRKTSG
jgi:2-dehydro-3-deoxyphosphogluconate aldolase / (4S)-4-hydroxy-2-oxoglutarate aldolase